MHNAITQSEKVNQTLPTFQGYGPARYRKCKTDIVIPREHGPSKKQESKRGTWRRALIYALEKKLRDKEREDRFRGARPPNLLNLDLYGLASFPFLLTPGRSHPRSMRVPAKTKEASQQTSKEINGRRSMLKD